MDERQQILMKLRRYYNGIVRINEQLDNDDITEEEAEAQLIALDEHFADRILSVKL